MKRDPDELCGRFVDDCRGVAHRGALRLTSANREQRGVDAAQRGRHLGSPFNARELDHDEVVLGPQPLDDPEQLVARERDRAVAFFSVATDRQVIEAFDLRNEDGVVKLGSTGDDVAPAGDAVTARRCASQPSSSVQET